MTPRAVRPARAKKCAAGLWEARLAGRITPGARTECIPVTTSPAGRQTLNSLVAGHPVVAGIGLAWAGYAAGANWQHVQRMVNAPAYIIAGLIALLVIAGIIAVIVRRRKRPPVTRPGSAGGPVSVGTSEKRRVN